MNPNELIARARALASLAWDATPGPWEWSCDRGAPVLLGNNKTRWVLKEQLSHHDPTGLTGRGMPSEEDKALIAAAPDMAELLERLADELVRHREALARIVTELGIDACGDIDLHEKAFEIAVSRDRSYEDGSRDPEPDDYAQALLEAVLDT